MVELARALWDRLASALMSLDWMAGPPRDGELSALYVAGGTGTELDESLRQAKSRKDTSCVAVVLDERSSEKAADAASITPFVYPAAIDPPSLARLLTSASDISGRARRRIVQPPAKLPLLVIDVGISVELDGSPLEMGVAERNFLFELAASRGALVPKDRKIRAEPSPVRAKECRRRLGKAITPELASALCPERRGDPYRLRTPEELEKLGLMRLRIKGRSGPPTTFLPDTDGFPED